MCRMQILELWKSKHLRHQVESYRLEMNSLFETTESIAKDSVMIECQGRNVF